MVKNKIPNNDDYYSESYSNIKINDIDNFWNNLIEKCEKEFEGTPDISNWSLNKNYLLSDYVETSEISAKFYSIVKINELKIKNKKFNKTLIVAYLPDKYYEKPKFEKMYNQNLCPLFYMDINNDKIDFFINDNGYFVIKFNDKIYITKNKFESAEYPIKLFNNKDFLNHIKEKVIYLYNNKKLIVDFTITTYDYKVLQEFDILITRYIKDNFDTYYD
jgi:hypothetical protein